MIKIVKQKKFIKRFKKLSKKIQLKTIDVLEILQNSPHDQSLRCHKLKGKFIGLETVDVTGDIRILIDFKTGYIIDILDIGNHNYFY